MITKVKTQNSIFLKQNMMASTLPDMIDEEFICCTLCLHSYHTPKVLPCLHSFCKNCLQDYITKHTNTINKFPCPVCQTYTEIPHGGSTGFKTNTFLANLAEIVLSQSAGDRKCNNCDATNANYRCLECQDYLCSGCQEAHGWLKITKGHHVMTLGELQSGKFHRELQKNHLGNCPVHRHTKSDLCCVDCNEAVCLKCKEERHKGHRFGDLQMAADRERHHIRGLMEATSDHMVMFQTALNQLKNYQDECNRNKAYVTGNILMQKEKLVKIIEDSCAQLITEIDTSYKAELEQVNEATDKVHTDLVSMQKACKFSEKLLKQGENADIMDMKTQVKEQLLRLETRQPRELNHRLYMQFIPTNVTMDDILLLIGRLGKKESAITKTFKRKKTIQLESQHQWTFTPSVLSVFKAKTDLDKKGCHPTGITTDGDDIIIVDDINKKIKAFDLTGNLLYEIAPKGKDALIDPWDVAMTTDDNFAVTDRGAREVKIFNKNSELLKRFGEHLENPWGIAVNNENKIIVTDIEKKNVFIHDSDGVLLHSIQNNLEQNLFACPEYVVVNVNGDIIVSDVKKHCILVFDSMGRFLFEYGSRGTQVGEFSIPCGISTDTEGNILAVDYENQRIHMLNANGRFKCFTATRTDKLNAPQTIAVDNEHHLVVVDGSYIKVFTYPHEQQQNSMENALQFFNRTYDEWSKNPVSPIETNI